MSSPMEKERMFIRLWLIISGWCAMLGIVFMIWHGFQPNYLYLAIAPFILGLAVYFLYFNVTLFVIGQAARLLAWIRN